MLDVLDIGGQRTTFWTTGEENVRISDMAGISRVVISGCPHHVTQHGNRRQQVFFADENYLADKELMGEWCEKCGTDKDQEISMVSPDILPRYPWSQD